MKLLKILLALLLVFLGLMMPVAADTSVQLDLKADKEHVRKEDYVEVSLFLPQTSEEGKTINALKGTLEFDERLFHELSSEEVVTVGAWGDFFYNPKNNQFTLVKRGEDAAQGEILRLRLYAKEDMTGGKTSITLKDVTLSEGTTEYAVQPRSLDVICVGSAPDPSLSQQEETTVEKEEIEQEDTMLGQQEAFDEQVPATGVSSIAVSLLLLVLVLSVSIVLLWNRRFGRNRFSKYLLALLAAVVLLTGAFAGHVYGKQKKGDLNSDGIVDTADIHLLEKHLIQLEQMEEKQLALADMKEDGRVSVSDLSLLVRKADSALIDRMEVDAYLKNTFFKKGEKPVLYLQMHPAGVPGMKHAVINEQRYPLKAEDAPGTYSISLDGMQQAKAYTLQVSEVEMTNGTRIKTDITKQIEVLKEEPTIRGFRIEKGGAGDRANILFELSDQDEALTYASMEIKERQKDGSYVSVQQEELQAGKHTVGAVFKEDASYRIEFHGRYRLDHKVLAAESEEYCGSFAVVKEYTHHMDEHFSLRNIETYRKDGTQASEFEAHEPFIVRLQSDSSLRAAPVYAVIGEKSYLLEKSKEADTYEFVYPGYAAAGGKTFGIDEIVLENGKTFRLSKEHSLSLTIRKRRPQLSEIEISEQEDAFILDVSMKLMDEDKALRAAYVRITDAQGRLLHEEDITKNVFDERIVLNEVLTPFYTVEVLVDYDVSADGSAVQKKQRLYAQRFAARKRAVVDKADADRTQVEKQEEITLRYALRTNRQEEIVSLIVDGVEHKVQKKDGLYQITLPSSQQAGHKKAELSGVIFADQQLLPVHAEIAYEVLKDKPQLKEYAVEEDMEHAQVHVSFVIEDEEEAFLSGKVQLYQDGKLYKEETLNNAGKQRVSFPIEEEKRYVLKVLFSYRRDESGAIKIEEEAVCEKELQMIRDYQLQIERFQTEKRYYERNEKIALSAKITTASSYSVDSIKIDGQYHKVSALEDGEYRLTIDGYPASGVHKLSMEALRLSNGKELAVKEETSVKIYVLKAIPQVDEVSYTESSGRVVLSYTLKDEDSALEKLSVVVKDGNIELGRNEHRKAGRYEIEVEAGSKESCQAYFYADYDRGNDSFPEGENTAFHQLLLQQELRFERKLIELKEIENIELYTKSDQVRSVREIDVESFDAQKYLAKLKMRKLPTLYAKIKEGFVREGIFYLKLDLERGVQYHGSDKSREIEVAYGTVHQGSALPSDFEGLIEQLRRDPNASIKLIKDLDASSYTTEDGAYIERFQGKLDGNGYAIHHLEKPLFHQTENAQISNLYIKEASVGGASNAILINEAKKTVLRGVHIRHSDIRTWHSDYTAALVGKAMENVRIEECSAKDVYVKSYKRVGGLVGYLCQGSQIKNSYMEGTVYGRVDGIGALVGQSEGSAAILSSFAKAELLLEKGGNPSGNGVGGLIGWSDKKNGIVIKNSLSLAEGNIGHRISGTNVHESSAQVYEMSSSALSSDADGKRIKEIHEESIRPSFFKDELAWDERIWELEELGQGEAPRLKKEAVSEEKEPYLPFEERLKQSGEYRSERRTAYANMYRLMPFYDASLYVTYGNRLSADSALVQKPLRGTALFDEAGNFVSALTKQTLDKPYKLRLVFEDESYEEHEVRFTETIQQIAVYEIASMQLEYQFDRYIIDTSHPLFLRLKQRLQEIDYDKDLAAVIGTDARLTDHRVYQEHYQRFVQPHLAAYAQALAVNAESFPLYLTDEIAEALIKQNIDGELLLRLLYSYVYVSKWYDIEITDRKAVGTEKVSRVLLSDVVYFTSSIMGGSSSPEKISDAILRKADQTLRQGNQTEQMYAVHFAKYLKEATVIDFIEYWIRSFSGYGEHADDWFAQEHFNGVLLEVPAKWKQEEVDYRAWSYIKDNERFRNGKLLLPLLSFDAKEMYLLSMPTQIVFGSMNVYDEYRLQPAEEGRQKILHMMQVLSEKSASFYGGIAQMVPDGAERLKDIRQIQVDRRIIAGEWQQETTATDSVIRGIYAPLGLISAHYTDGSASAYAETNAIFWNYQALKNYTTMTHESGHNIDTRVFLLGKGRRENGSREDYNDGIFTQSDQPDHFQINLTWDKEYDSDSGLNLSVERLHSPEAAASFYRGKFRALDILDYLEAQAFLRLTSEQQSKLALQHSYPKLKDAQDQTPAARMTSCWNARSAAQFAEMKLESVEDLWDHQIMLYPSASDGTQMANNRYGGESIQSVYWYQPHNDYGRPNSFAFKRTALQMMGEGGYMGYVTYMSNDNENDLQALRAVLQDEAVTWKTYRMKRYEEIAEELKSMPFLDEETVIDSFQRAMELDASGEEGYKNKNSGLLRNILYRYMQRISRDFREPLSAASNVTAITSAKQLLDEIKKDPTGSYRLEADIDMSAYQEETALLAMSFSGMLDGNGHALVGLKQPLFQSLKFASIHDLRIEQASFGIQAKGYLAQYAEKTYLHDVTASQLNIVLPSVGTQKNVWVDGDTSAEAAVIEIADAQQLQAIGESELSKARKYRLVKDIDASALPVEKAVVMGRFRGELDGGGHAIRGLKQPLFQELSGKVYDLSLQDARLQLPTQQDVGLLACRSEDAELFDLRVYDAHIEARQHLGTLVGYAVDTLFQRIALEDVQVKGNHFYAGGLVGRSYNSRYEDISIHGKLEITKTHNGGMIGTSEGDVIRRVYAGIDVSRTTEGDRRNKNAGLFGTTEGKKATEVQDVIVCGDMSPSLFKITAADEQKEIDRIESAMRNVYEYEGSSGRSNAELSVKAIQKASEAQLKHERFYTEELHWSKEVWDFSTVAQDGRPRLR